MHVYTAVVELQLLTLPGSIRASLSHNECPERGNLSILPTFSPRQKNISYVQAVWEELLPVEPNERSDGGLPVQLPRLHNLNNS